LIGERLKSLRIEQKKTQQEMADTFGIARGTYAHYEINRREPDNATLTKLADYFNVTTDYLLGRSKNRTTQQSSLTDIPAAALLPRIMEKYDQMHLSSEEQAALNQLREMPSPKQAELLQRLIDKIKSLPVEHQKALGVIIDSLASSQK